jgi:hypothetical protein
VIPNSIFNVERQDQNSGALGYCTKIQLEKKKPDFLISGLRN